MQPSSQKQTDAAIEGRVFNRQIDLLYEGLPYAVVSTVIVVVLTFGFLSYSTDMATLGPWFILFCLILPGRLVTGWMYAKRKARFQLNYQHAEHIYTAGIILTGLLWGAMGLLLLPELDLQGKILLFIVIMGIAAASNPSIGYRELPVYSFVMLLILPLTLGVNLSDFPNALAITIAMLFYVAFLLRTARKFYSSTENMLRLQEIAIDREQKLLMQREEAQLANFAKSEFLSRMSHELRTPLNAVLGMNELQMLDRNDPLSENQLRRAQKINEAGGHLLLLVNDVLDFARIESGDIDIKLESIDSQAVLRDSLRLIEGKVSQRGIKVFIDQTPACIWVRADKIRLKQVLVNLLDNAVKYNRQGGTVTVSMRPNERAMCRISVVDTGYGIAQESLHKLFTPFSRLGAEQLGIDGTGIGLSFSKQLVELMAGEIGVESRLGKGSCFWVELPCATEPDSAASIENVAVQADQSRTAADKSALAAGRLLLAEDNLVNQEVAIDMLEQGGYEVDVANNGEEALQYLNRRDYALVLMDCEMPILDGYAVTRLLREKETTEELVRTPVVALTAHAVEGARDKCIDSGMDDFLTKPFSYAGLEAMVEKWVFKKRISPPVTSSQTNTILDARHDNEAAIDAILNADALSQLRARQQKTGRSLIRRVIGVYLEQTPQLLKEMGDAGEKGDIETVLNIAHTLKSSSMTIGAVPLADACRKIEALGEQGIALEDKILEVNRIYSNVMLALESVLAQEK
jgi:signal transduction histidine kinase/DNA-binding NarL/FixJ family response regulator